VRAVRTAYKGYEIETAATKHPAVGWIASAHVYAVDSTRARESLDLGRAVTFATEELAHWGALHLGRAWVDGQKPQ
jgi:hypothetical protein